MRTEPCCLYLYPHCPAELDLRRSSSNDLAELAGFELELPHGKEDSSVNHWLEI